MTIPVRTSAVAMLLVLLGVNAAHAADAARVQRLRTPGGVEFAVLGDKPAKPAATLFVFAVDAERTLDSRDFNAVGAALARDGFLCVSLDAPCHGRDRRDGPANELSAWRGRVEQGGGELVDDFVGRCKAVLDHLIADGWTDPARVAAAGTSRGGFLALHLAAAEPRVRSVAAFAPVTRLRALDEFRDMTGEAARAADALDLERVADKLAGRRIWVCIGNDDRRVGTDHAIAFTRRVVAASVVAKVPARVEIHVTSSEGHAVHRTAHAEAAAFLAAAPPSD